MYSTIHLHSYLRISSYKTIDSHGQRVVHAGEGRRVGDREDLVAGLISLEGDAFLNDALLCLGPRSITISGPWSQAASIAGAQGHNTALCGNGSRCQGPPTIADFFILMCCGLLLLIEYSFHGSTAFVCIPSLGYLIFVYR